MPKRIKYKPPDHSKRKEEEGIDKVIKSLSEYIDLSNDEWSESMMLLINLWNYRAGLSQTLRIVIAMELRENLFWAQNNLEIVEEVIEEKRTTKSLIHK